MFRLFSLLILFVFISSTAYSQENTQAKLQQRKYEEKMLEKRDELIQDFLEGLEVDDFQKAIIEQKINSYIQKKEAIYKEGHKSYVLKEKIEVLDNTHFQDISSMLSSETMAEIKDFLGSNDSSSEKKKKKRKKKNQDQDNQDDNN